MLPNAAPGDNSISSRDHVFNAWWIGPGVLVLRLFYDLMSWLDVNWITNIITIHGRGPLLQGFHRTAVTVLAIGIAATLLAVFYPHVDLRLDTAPSRLRRTMLLPPVLIFAAFYPMDLKAHYIIRNQWVEDVGKITIRSDNFLMRGINPYTVDVQEPWQQSVKTRGYSYFPMMLLVYLPSALIFSDPDQAILLSNLVFAAISLALLAWIARREISLDAALYAMLLFLLSALIRMEFIRSGTNDMVPTLFALSALLMIRRRFTCGLMIGLAISSKVLPGLFWIPLCLTPLSLRRYLAGIVAGLVPIVPFLLWNAKGFTDNTLSSIAARASEANSLFYGHPAWQSKVAQVVVLLGFAAFALHVYRQEMPLARRCAFAAGLMALFQAASPLMHQNYFLWWYAPLCLALTGLIFWPPLYQWIGSDSRSAGRNIQHADGSAIDFEMTGN